MSKVIELLKNQKKIEIEHIEKLSPDMKKAGNPIVKALLESIIRDSEKHASLCQALIDVDIGSAPILLDVDMSTALSLHQNIKQHVNVEAEMIVRLEKVINKIEDDRVKYVLEYMLEDEKRHHAVLKELSNIIDRDDAAMEEYLELFQKFMIVPP